MMHNNHWNKFVKNNCKSVWNCEVNISESVPVTCKLQNIM